MSITDELREWAHGFNGPWKRNEKMLLDIADRIDAKHEEAIQQALMDEGGVPATDENMAEYGWVRLPKDANGECIRIGDVMEWIRYKDDDTTIVRTVSAVGVGVFFAWSDEQGRYAQYEASAYRHHEPTVEDVLREMLDAWGELPSNATNEAIIAEYAAKLRLAESEDA